MLTIMITTILLGQNSPNSSFKSYDHIISEENFLKTTGVVERESFFRNVNAACSESAPANGIEWSVEVTVAGNQRAAADITVPADTNFNLTQLSANFILLDADFVTSAEIIIYENTLIFDGFVGDFVNIPDSNSEVANISALAPTSESTISDVPTATAYDLRELIFDLPSPVLLQGNLGDETSYWISIAVATDLGASAAWQVVLDGKVGHEYRYNNLGNVDSWFASGIGGSPFPPFSNELVYTWNGDCENILGIDDFDFFNFDFYPNPASEVIHINASEAIQNLEIYDMLGKKVLSKNINDFNYEVNISSLAKGMYFMKATINDKVGIYEFIKS